MNEEGLLVSPKFDTPSEYLRQGKMTEFDMDILRLASRVKSKGNDENTIIELINLMNKETKRLDKAFRDQRKFKRTASEILASGQRTGCCDSATLFTAMARSQGIPTMQIITVRKEDALKSLKDGSTVCSGHFWVGCYAKNEAGENEWMLFNSDSNQPRRMEWDLEDRNIRDCYAFAYVNDYRDVELVRDDKLGILKIDSIDSMNQIQTEVARRCDTSLFKEDIRKSRDDIEREL